MMEEEKGKGSPCSWAAVGCILLGLMPDWVWGVVIFLGRPVGVNLEDLRYGGPTFPGSHALILPAIFMVAAVVLGTVGHLRRETLRRAGLVTAGVAALVLAYLAVTAVLSRPAIRQLDKRSQGTILLLAEGEGKCSGELSGCMLYAPTVFRD